MKLTQKFIKIGLINLLVVAIIGALMRYKIGFDFPFFDQKNLQHGHSHFAFSGWVSHILYLTLTSFLFSNYALKNQNRYVMLIYANLISAYGMLISFILQGYGIYSIFFSSISVIISFVFSFSFIKDVYQIGWKHPAIPWFIAGLFWNVFSSLGTVSLGYMMGTHNFNQHVYLGSIYFYLHFQYSGWFFFACTGLFICQLYNISHIDFDASSNKKAFYLFTFACLPAYLLSMLWIHLPWYIYVFAVVAVTIQLIGLYYLIKLVFASKYLILGHWHKEIYTMYLLAFLALIIKLLLQAGSTIPEISKLAFGFRSIVIAYLHLVLLGFVSLFLIGYIIHTSGIKPKITIIVGLIIFCLGVFLNELVLMVQGIASFSYTLIPYLNQMLFGVSLILLLGLLFLIKGYSSALKK